jgi:hypothetical protein
MLVVRTISRWVSVGSDLKYDARRDLDDVGAMCVQGMMPLTFILQFSFFFNLIMLHLQQYMLSRVRQM